MAVKSVISQSEEQRLRMSENKMMRVTLGLARENCTMRSFMI
jgi:hypothetical protein